MVSLSSDRTGYVVHCLTDRKLSGDQSSGGQSGGEFEIGVRGNLEVVGRVEWPDAGGPKFGIGEARKRSLNKFVFIINL